MSHEVTKELSIMFLRAVEDVTKANMLIRTKASITEAADRFIKLARRFYDIYKLFFEEFRHSIDCVAARCMLQFIRACFIISNVLFNTVWEKPGSLRRTIRRLGTAPQRAAHKVMKRTIMKNEYRYNYPEEAYEQAGFAKLFSFEHKRKPKDELNQVTVGLKEAGSRLLNLFNNSNLIDPKASLLSVQENIPKTENFGLGRAKKDLKKCAKVLKIYYETVIEELSKKKNPYESDGSPVDHDRCLIPVLAQLGMKERKTLRGYSKNANKPVVVAVTDDNVAFVTEKIILLDKAPMD